MAELNQGFKPFDQYNAGNDYNPLGYGTAKVMKLSGDSIFALSAVPSGDIHHDGCGGTYEWTEVEVLRNVVDKSFNKFEFIDGVWHATSDTGEGQYEKPSVMSFTMNIPEFNAVEDTAPFTSLDIASKINQGSAEEITTTLKLVSGDRSIVLYKTSSPNINVSITDEDIMDTINEMIKNCINFDIVMDIDDGKSVVETKNTVKSVHYCYFGWVNDLTNIDLTTIMNTNATSTNAVEGKRAKAVDYDSKKAYFGAFTPTDQYMYIAVPKQIGMIKSICNGAAVYSVGTTNTDFIRSEVTISGIQYYLHVLQYANHGTYNMLAVFNKGV